LAIPDRISLLNEIRCRIVEIAMRIAATIRDKRIKTILYKFVRLTVQIGCRIALSFDTLADIRLSGYATNEIR